jgi:hypothetical protein
MKKVLNVKGFKISYNSLFLIIFLAVSLFYNYQQIIFYRPIGIHLWRNAVCAAYAQNYYYGADFFEPETSSYISKGGTSDVAVAEFPGFYYLVGLLYEIFGLNEMLYRLFNVFVGYLGLFALYKLCRELFKDNFYAFVVPFLIFSSGVYVFYLNNFIIDSTSLSIAFIGLYFFYKYYTTRKLGFLFGSMGLFLFAGAMKPPALIIYFSLLAIYGLEVFLRLKWKNEKIFKRPIIEISAFLLVIAGVFAWYYYSSYYTQKYGGEISPVDTRSYLIVDEAGRMEIWGEMKRRFNLGYFHSPLFIYLTGGILLFNLIFLNKFYKILNILTFLSFIQVLLFSFLFFYSLGRCDYYQISNLAFVALLYINFILYLRKNHNVLFNSLYTKIATAILVILLINDCRSNIKRRYKDWSYKSTLERFVSTYGRMENYNRQLGIGRNDRVYVTNDPSIDISLYLMNQKGNTHFGVPGTTPKEKIKSLIPLGLQYVFVNDSSVYEEDGIEKYLNHKIGQFKNIEIYKIPQAHFEAVNNE